jgi:hypothetical protein
MRKKASDDDRPARIISAIEIVAAAVGGLTYYIIRTAMTWRSWDAAERKNRSGLATSSFSPNFRQNLKRAVSSVDGT